MMILTLWLSLAALPIELRVDGEACRAAIEAHATGELIQIEDETGRLHRVVRVACEPCPCTEGPTS